MQVITTTQAEIRTGINPVHYKRLESRLIQRGETLVVLLRKGSGAATVFMGLHSFSVNGVACNVAEVLSTDTVNKVLVKTQGAIGAPALYFGTMKAAGMTAAIPTLVADVFEQGQYAEGGTGGTGGTGDGGTGDGGTGGDKIQGIKPAGDILPDLNETLKTLMVAAVVIAGLYIALKFVK